MSVKQFCKEQGLTEYSFYAWRKRIQQRGPVRFALVERNARQPERQAEAVLELVLATGERLRIGPGVDLTTLRTVLDVGGNPRRSKTVAKERFAGSRVRRESGPWATSSSGYIHTLRYRAQATLFSNPPFLCRAPCSESDNFSAARNRALESPGRAWRYALVVATEECPSVAWTK